jgi:hypothetical protein
VYANGSVLNSIGFLTGATLTITQSGARVTAAYDDSNGNSSSLGFAVKTSASAALTAPAQFETNDVSGDCVLGVGVSNEFFYPMEMDASAGALTYDAGTMFVSLEGKVEGDGGPCGGQAFPASLWLICDDGPAPAPAESAPSAPSLPAGNFTCTSQIATFYNDGKGSQYVAGGGDGGKLTLSRTGADVVAEYSGDLFVTGTMRLRAATPTAALAEAGQSLATSCDVLLGGVNGGLSETRGPLPIAAGSLSIDDGTLFLSFTGYMSKDSICAGAEKAASLICTKQ